LIKPVNAIDEQDWKIMPIRSCAPEGPRVYLCEKRRYTHPKRGAWAKRLTKIWEV
jgi:hypothetical protein